MLQCTCISWHIPAFYNNTKIFQQYTYMYIYISGFYILGGGRGGGGGGGGKLLVTYLFRPAVLHGEVFSQEKKG